MNVHSDEWIMNKLREHYEDAVKVIAPNNIVGLFYQGSGNYGMDYEDSDVDSKLIVTPTINDLIDSNQPHSETFVRENDEHIDIKDIRNIVNTFKRQNMNFIEILFTKYYIINPTYENEWNMLIENREQIARISVQTSINAMVGVASEKYFALTHEYPSRMDWIRKYGYDPKQLHHLLRVEEFLKRYISGEKYEDILTPKNTNFLVSVKTGNAYTFEQAIEIADDAYKNVHCMKKNYVNNNQVNDNPDMLNILDYVQHQILLKSVILQAKTFT